MMPPLSKKIRATPLLPTPVDLEVLHKTQEWPLLIVDIETTGLNPEEDRIIELGAVKVVDGRVRSYHNWLIRPAVSLKPEITALTGLTDQILRGQASEEFVIREFAKISEGAVVVAHNVGFERAFLKNAAQRHHIPLDTAGYACTLRLAHHVHYPQPLTSYKLGALCHHHHIHNTRPHRALPDAKATTQLLKKLQTITRTTTRIAA